MSQRNPGRLHVITDTVLQSRFDHVELARMAFAGGADVVQFRDKRTQLGRSDRVEIVRRALRFGGRLLVNDDVEVALESGAAGVHLGRDDTPVERARSRLGSMAWIGSTANSMREARRRAAEPADYLGVGPVFATDTKDRPAAPLGVDGLSRIAAEVDLPVIAIGGIDASNVEKVMATGVFGVAVVSAVCCAERPEEATRELARRVGG